MEIICTNGKFSADILEFYKIHGVSVPVEDSLYNIRKVVRNSNGQIGLLLEEIINPEIPIKHAILGIGKMEPNFNVNRFSHLNGLIITNEELKLIKQNQTVDKDGTS